MSKDDYFKFFVQDDVETARRMDILKKGVSNAKKESARVAGYQKLRKLQIIHAMQKKESI